MTGTLLYLDHNATAPVLPAVIAAMADALSRPGNASSVHRFGRTARRDIDAARVEVAALVGAEDLVFVGGGTEANHLALLGTGRRRVLISAIEHDSVRQVLADPVVIPVTSQGIVDLAALDRLLAASDEPAVVSVMAANNETGIIQPVAEAARIAHARGALFHCDGIQAAGKIPLDMAALDIDLLSLSAHKLGGPQGIGGLALRRDLPLAPQLRGGGQERGRRAGTEAVPAIVGFGVAARFAARGLAAYAEIAGQRNAIEERLLAAAAEAGLAAQVFGRDLPRLPNTCCIALAGVPAETQVMAFDLAGIAVSAGSACSSGKVRRSAVLTAMGVGDDIADAAIRLSLGPTTPPAVGDRVAAAWANLLKRAAARRPAA
jgi:cysteine desulfurase